MSSCAILYTILGFILYYTGLYTILGLFGCYQTQATTCLFVNPPLRRPTPCVLPLRLVSAALICDACLVCACTCVCVRVCVCMCVCMCLCMCMCMCMCICMCVRVRVYGCTCVCTHHRDDVVNAARAQLLEQQQLRREDSERERAPPAAASGHVQQVQGILAHVTAQSNLSPEAKVTTPNLKPKPEPSTLTRGVERAVLSPRGFGPSTKYQDSVPSQRHTHSAVVHRD